MSKKYFHNNIDELYIKCKMYTIRNTPKITFFWKYILKYFKA